MASSPTYYELLGVEPTAEQSEIKSAFRQQIMRNHPDHGGNPVLFRMLEDAYETLVSPSRRAEYDRALMNEGTPPGGYRFDSATFQDREPGPESNWDDDAYGSAFGGGANDGDRTAQQGAAGAAPVFTRPASGTAWPSWLPSKAITWRIGLIAFVIWLLIATASGLPAIPGVDNAGVALGLLWVASFWIFGSFALRMLGWFVAFWALSDAYVNDADPASTALRLVLALGLWLTGHWLFTFKQGHWRSSLAHSMLGRLPLALRPDRRMGGF